MIPWALWIVVANDQTQEDGCVNHHFFFSIGFIKHYFWYITFKDNKAILKSQIWEICGKSLKKYTSQSEIYILIYTYSITQIFLTWTLTSFVVVNFPLTTWPDSAAAMSFRKHLTSGVTGAAMGGTGAKGIFRIELEEVSQSEIQLTTWDLWLASEMGAVLWDWTTDKCDLTLTPGR